MAKEVTLPSGVVVTVTSVPGRILLDLLNTIPEPKPPVITREGTTRTEENTSDPEYQTALTKYKTDQGKLAQEIYITQGIRKVISIPEDKIALDDDEWIDKLELLGLKPAREPKMARWRDWLLYHIVDEGDVAFLMTEVAVAGGGVTEDLVKAASDSFRPEQAGPSNNGVPATPAVRQPDTTGDVATGPSEQVRTEGSSPLYTD